MRQGHLDYCYNKYLIISRCMASKIGTLKTASPKALK